MLNKALRYVVSRVVSLTNRAVIKLMKCMPVKNNYIVLESEGDFWDNGRCFYEYMLANNKNKQYKIIWIVHEPKQYAAHENVVFVSRHGNRIHWKADYYIAVSKFFVFTHPGWLKKWRKEQIVINTTHSASQLKKAVICKQRVADYVLVCGDFVAGYRCKKFLLPIDHMLTVGMPRIDLLYQHKDCWPKLIPGYNGEKVILAMPTMKKAINWNDSSSATDFAIGIIQSYDELKSLDQMLREHNYYMVIKIHHLQDLTALQMYQCSRILYIKDEQLQKYDIQTNELLENSDILLSDYSSVFYEYLLLDRPIGFMVRDLEEYSRGFEWDNITEEMPGQLIRTVSDLTDFLNDISAGVDPYQGAREKIKNKIFKYTDNHNCERLMEWIDNQ